MRQRKQMKRKSKSWYIKFIPWHIEHFAKLQFLNDRIDQNTNLTKSPSAKGFCFFVNFFIV